LATRSPGWRSGGALFLGGERLPELISIPLRPHADDAVSGAADTVDIDVYVNGLIVRRQQLQPGTFDITSSAARRADR
jgi:hypothetical protein